MDEADRLLDMGYEKDVAAIVKAIEDHKKAATYDPMAMVKQNIVKKINIDEETQEPEINEETAVQPVKHHLTDVFLSNERQTILLSATLTKVMKCNENARVNCSLPKNIGNQFVFDFKLLKFS